MTNQLISFSQPSVVATSVAVQPKCRLGHPENYLFLLSKNMFVGSKNPKINKFNFEKNFTGGSISSDCDNPAGSDVTIHDVAARRNVQILCNTPRTGTIQLARTEFRHAQ